MKYIINGSTLTDIADVIRAKLGNSGELTPLEMPDAIASIPTGGAVSLPMSDVNFYDYDGTILYSYSKVEFLALTELPPNPSHAGLTAQGWNWSYADAIAYVTEHGALNVGQMYITDDGVTRISIRLKEGRLHPYSQFYVNGTVTVDWGDGSIPDTATTTYNQLKTFDHEYAQPGGYTISIFPAEDSAIQLYGSSGSQVGSCVLRSQSGNASPNKAYQSCIQRVCIGRNCTLGAYAFRYCYSLESITIPVGITSIGQSTFNECSALASITIPNGVTSIDLAAFYKCYALASAAIPNSVTSIGQQAFNACIPLSDLTIPNGVTSISINVFGNSYGFASVIIPDSVTSIGTSAFNGCYSLASVTLPADVTSIGQQAFNDCWGLCFIRFKSTTPPTAGSNAFASLPTDCKIYVPEASLDLYKAAANYPDPQTYEYIGY